MRPAISGSDGDGEQAADPGDGVVDPRGDPGVAGVGGGEDGRRDRRDDEGEAEAEDDDGRQDRGHVARRPGSIWAISSIPSAITSGPTVSGIRGPIRWARAPERAENSSIRSVTGSEAAPAAIGE